MNNTKGNLKMYHGQAEADVFAKVLDLSDRIIRTSMKEIKAAYEEFMQELMLESQEAY